MRLRPSGRSGPVAVRLSSFERYHFEDAWTWEHMALTRLRPIADRNGLGQKVQALTQKILAQSRQEESLRADIHDMRKRLATEKPGKGLWDIKQGAGGLVDLEFIVQQGLLSLGHIAAVSPLIPKAIQRLESAGRLTLFEAEALLGGHAFLSSLQQIQRIAVKGDINPETVSAGLKDRLQRSVNMPDFETLQTALADHKSKIESIRIARIGAI